MREYASGAGHISSCERDEHVKSNNGELLIQVVCSFIFGHRSLLQKTLLSWWLLFAALLPVDLLLRGVFGYYSAKFLLLITALGHVCARSDVLIVPPPASTIAVSAKAPLPPTQPPKPSPTLPQDNEDLCPKCEGSRETLINSPSPSTLPPTATRLSTQQLASPSRFSETCCLTSCLLSELTAVPPPPIYVVDDKNATN